MKVYLKDSKHIGNDIRLFRIRKHWSQKDLALQLNVSSQAISNWERGESYMSLDIIVKLSQLMSVSLDDFLLYDIHGSYSYVSIFDRLRLSDFWIDLIDIQKESKQGEIFIDIRVQYVRYTLFLDELFRVNLYNYKEQEIPFYVHGWREEEIANNQPTQEITRIYRISYRQVHQACFLSITYNSIVKQIHLDDKIIETDPELHQKIIEFFMKTRQANRLVDYMNHMKEINTT